MKKINSAHTLRIFLFTSAFCLPPSAFPLCGLFGGAGQVGIFVFDYGV
jgi:hypothetical protein